MASLVPVLHTLPGTNSIPVATQQLGTVADPVRTISTTDVLAVMLLKAREPEKAATVPTAWTVGKAGSATNLPERSEPNALTMARPT